MQKQNNESAYHVGSYILIWSRVESEAGGHRQRAVSREYAARRLARMRAVAAHLKKDIRTERQPSGQAFFALTGQFRDFWITAPHGLD